MELYSQDHRPVASKSNFCRLHAPNFWEEMATYFLSPLHYKSKFWSSLKWIFQSNYWSGEDGKPGYWHAVRWLLTQQDLGAKQKVSGVFLHILKSKYLRIVCANFALDYFLPKFLNFLSSHSSSISSIVRS